MSSDFQKSSWLQKRSHWQKTEKLLREALQFASGRLDPSKISEVEEYLSHNELGLALEVLEDGLAETNIPADPKLRVFLCAARERMGLEPLKNWEATR